MNAYEEGVNGFEDMDALNRQGYYLAQLQPESQTEAQADVQTQKPAGRWDALVRFDFPSRTRQVLPFLDGDLVNEPVFVPASGGGGGQGYLLALVYREKTGTSDLLILDAARIDAGPIAVVHVPHRVPFGFHGSWVGEASGPV